MHALGMYPGTCQSQCSFLGSSSYRRKQERQSYGFDCSFRCVKPQPIGQCLVADTRIVLGSNRTGPDT
eukprot:1848351-Prymnesium_polylepis.1